MASTPKWYTDYINWYNQNMSQYADNPSAQKQFHSYALHYYDQIQNKQKATKAEKERGKAQIAGLAAAVGGPAAFWLTKSAVTPAATTAATTAASAAPGLTALGEAGTAASAVPVSAAAPVATEGAAGLTALGEAGAVEAAPGLLGQFGALGVGPQAGILGGLALGAKGLSDLVKGKETKGIEGWGGRATLGMATGGLSEVGRAFGLGQKSTDDYRNERIEALGETSPQWQNYQQQRYDAEKAGTSSHDGWEKGEKWNWEKALDLAKNDGTHFAGVMGNAETFGDEFLGLDQEKQKQISQELANQGLYHSNKGNVLIADDKQQQARDIYAQLIGGNQ